MKVLVHDFAGETRIAFVENNAPQEIIIRRDLSLNFGDVVMAKITAYHPVLKGYFAVADTGAVFIPTQQKLTEGQSVRVKIVKEARRDKDAVGRITDEEYTPPVIAGETVSAGEMDDLVDEAMSPDVSLKNGGMLHIERTRVCWVIDVDTGKNSEAWAAVNQAAVPEIARQIRLKNMGGIILIDFAGTKRIGVRRQLEKQLRECLAADDLARVRGWSPSGLAEIKRKREHADLWLTFSGSNPINTYYRVRRALDACRFGNPKVYVAPAVLNLLKQAGVRVRTEPVYDKTVSYFEIRED